MIQKEKTSSDFVWRSWVLLGPLALLLTTIIAFIRLNGPLVLFPMVAIAGLVLIHFWKWRGVLATALVMTALCAYMMITYTQDIWLWNVVLAAACTCSLVVARLGFDEYESLTSGRLREAERDRHMLNEVKVSSLKAEEAFKIESLNMQSHADALRNEIQLCKDTLEAKDHLLGLVRDEISVVDNDRQKLIKSVIDLQREINDLQHSNKGLKAQINEHIQHESVVQEMTAFIKSLQDTIEKMKEERECLQKENQNLSEDLASGRESRRLQGIYNQLREQFDQKCKVLDETRRELFLSQEKVMATQKELEQREFTVETKLLDEAMKEIEQMEKSHREEVQKLQNLIDTFMEVKI